MNYQDKIDAAVYAAMQALGVSAERCPELAESLNHSIDTAARAYVTGDDDDNL